MPVRNCLFVTIAGVVLSVAMIAWGVASSGEICDMAFDDFVRVGGATYERQPDSPTARIGRDDLASVYATVERNAVDVADCEYRPRDGDASDLPAGTRLYAVQGFAPTSLLAALATDGTLLLYEATAVDNTGSPLPPATLGSIGSPLAALDLVMPATGRR